MGVCTDVIIRSVRNAGLDLQKELHEDILKRRSAFPMIRKGKGPDANIDQRRVGTLLPYFQKHWESHSAKLDDATMARLNASVDVDKKTVEDVAKTFLKEQGLI